MLQRPGSSWGFGALLKDTSVVVLKEDTPTIPARTWDSNPQPSAYKSDLLSIRPQLGCVRACVRVCVCARVCVFQISKTWLHASKPKTNVNYILSVRPFRCFVGINPERRTKKLKGSKNKRANGAVETGWSEPTCCHSSLQSEGFSVEFLKCKYTPQDLFSLFITLYLYLTVPVIPLSVSDCIMFFNISYILSSLFFLIFLATLCILGWNSVWSLTVLFLIRNFAGLTWGLVVWACWTVHEMVKIHQSLWFLELFNYDHVG